MISLWSFICLKLNLELDENLPLLKCFNKNKNGYKNFQDCCWINGCYVTLKPGGLLSKWVGKCMLPHVRFVIRPVLVRTYHTAYACQLFINLSISTLYTRFCLAFPYNMLLKSLLPFMILVLQHDRWVDGCKSKSWDCIQQTLMSKVSWHSKEKGYLAIRGGAAVVVVVDT